VRSFRSFIAAIRVAIGVTSLAAVFAISSAASLRADDVENMQGQIAAWNRSHICPSQGEYDLLKFESYCKPFCDKGWTCHGTKETDPCYGGNGNSDACKEFSRGADQCLKDMNQKNDTILE
jgi:hypothetical protein